MATWLATEVKRGALADKLTELDNAGQTIFSIVRDQGDVSVTIISHD